MGMGAGGMANAVVLVFTLLAGLVVFLRLLTRGVILRNLGFEDVYSTFAMLTSVGLAVTIAIQIQNGLGMHIYNLTPEQMVNSQKAFWASVWIYNLSLTSTKLSILVQYLRIFPNSGFRRVCFVSIGVVAAWGVWSVFGNVFICLPVSFFWDKKTPGGGKCLNEALVWFMTAVVNIIQDVAILCMPIQVIRNLTIPVRQKKALIVVFLLGGIVCVVSIVRLKTLVAISNSTDPTFDNLSAAVSSAVEVNFGIICACLPSMRPLLSTMMPRYFPKASGNSNTNGRRTYDEERAMKLQSSSVKSVSYPPRTADSKSHPRSGSKTQPYYFARTSESDQSRTDSVHNNSHSHSKSRSQPENTYRGRTDANFAKLAKPSTTHSRNQSSPQLSLETLYRGPSDIINTRPSTQPQTHTHLRNPSNKNTSAAHSRNRSQPDAATRDKPYPLKTSVHHQHQLHPLRLSPHTTGAPKLPRFPETLANFEPFQRPLLRSPLGPPDTPRRMVFHKPLPVTPYPISTKPTEDSTG